MASQGAGGMTVGALLLWWMCLWLTVALLIGWLT